MNKHVCLFGIILLVTLASMNTGVTSLPGGNKTSPGETNPDSQEDTGSDSTGDDSSSDIEVPKLKSG